MSSREWIESTSVPTRAEIAAWVQANCTSNLTKSEGIFGPPTAADEYISHYVTAFFTRYRLAADQVGTVLGRLRELVAEEVAGGREVGGDKTAEFFDVAVDYLRHIDPAEATGFDGCIPEGTPEDLCPGDIKEMLLNCTTAIKRKYFEDRMNADRMKKIFFTQIIPRAMEAATTMMGMLEELEGEEFDCWMDELDELGYAMAVVAPEGQVFWPTKTIDGLSGKLFAPMGTSLELSAQKPCSLTNNQGVVLFLFSEWYELIKFVYEGSMSPWLMFLSDDDLGENAVNADPRWVVGALAEWRENFLAVDMSVALTSSMSSAVRDFIDV